MFAKCSTEARNGAIALLGHHLKGTLRIGTLLADRQVRVAALTPDLTAGDILAAHASLRADITRLLELEVTLLAKLRQARHWAASLTGRREMLASFARLFLAASQIIDTALDKLADVDVARFQTAGQAISFLESRSLLPAKIGGLATVGDIRTDAEYKIGGAVRLGDLLESCEGFLIVLDRLESRICETVAGKSLVAGDESESAAEDEEDDEDGEEEGVTPCERDMAHDLTGEDLVAGDESESVAEDDENGDEDVVTLCEGDMAHDLTGEDFVAGDESKSAAG